MQLLHAEMSQANSHAGEARGFDFVLALGNFSARDEDVFVQLHAVEASQAESTEPLGPTLSDALESELDDEARDGLRAAGERVAGERAGDPSASGTADGADTARPAEVPPLTLGMGGRPEVTRALDVPAGRVYSVILGNRTTHARYFLPTEIEATKLLHALALTPPLAVAAQSPRVASDARRESAAAEEGGAATVLLENALERPTLDIISERIARCWTPAFCLDYDGTLAPMVNDPSAARLPPGTKALLKELSDRHPTAIVSGRSMDKLRSWVDINGLYFAGSHGFEMAGPHGSHLNYTVALELLPTIQLALAELQRQLLGVPGVSIEDNKFALSVHTRNVSAEHMPRLDELLEAALEEQPLLRRSEGKHVIELRPQVHWHKGRAVEWLLKNMCEQMGLPGGVAERNKRVVPIYIGDDTTDEDAFRLLRSNDHGIPIVVREAAPRSNETSAEFWLRQREVADFLALFLHDRVLIRLPEDGSQDGREALEAEGAAEGQQEQPRAQRAGEGRNGDGKDQGPPRRAGGLAVPPAGLVTS